MDEKLMKKAKKRVEEKKGFYGHLSTYIAMAIFFMVMNFVTWDGEFWFFFPLLPWGVGLLIHYFSVFGLPFNQILSSDWEDKELAKEIQRLQQKKGVDVSEISDEQLELRELEKQKSKDWREEDLV